MTTFTKRCVVFLIVAFSILLFFNLGQRLDPNESLVSIRLDVQHLEDGRYFYTEKDKSIYPTVFELGSDGVLSELKKMKDPQSFIVVKQLDGFFKYSLQRHWGWWSLLPAFIAIMMCWITKDPISSLLSGVIAGALLMGKTNVLDDVLLESMATESAAGIILLYLWLLGGLMGIWSKMGAPKSFADWISRHVVKGPRSAKLVAWSLGILFFQGGTISTVLVGTTVKPITDKQHISHEEISYIVDSTASPIASQLAFNAWPGYIQAFIYVAGVSFLATETDRIAFFFKSVPFCFYAILAVTGTFLMSINKAPFLGKQMKEAIHRANTTQELDHPDSEPLSAKELTIANVPKGYESSPYDFLCPIVTLLSIAIGSFIVTGIPDVRLAFAASLGLAIIMAMIKGMSLKDVMDGIGLGFKGVVVGSVILVLAITLGMVSKSTGGGVFLVELFGQSLPYWILPVILQLLTITIAFSTGTSWGTYAVAFPLAMPLAWAIATTQGLAYPELYMTICFAAVMDGSVFGDQCSPISDTTVLSAMCTGCDLMDHVKTQIPQATIAAGLAAILWTAVVVIFC